MPSSNPPVPAPEWLLPLVLKRESAPTSSLPIWNRPAATEHEKAYALAALRSEYAELAAATGGEGNHRNAALNKFAMCMGEQVGAGWIERTIVEDAGMDGAEKNGYIAKDSKAVAWNTLQSGLKAGINKPRNPLPQSLDPHPELANPFLTNSATPFRIANIKSPLEYSNSETTWIVKGMIPSGITTQITASKGSGKSSLLTRMAVAIASGEPFLGRKTTKRPVLYLDRENQLRVIRYRFEMLKLKTLPDNYKHFGQWCGPQPMQPWEDVVLNWIREQKELPVIAIDAFGSFRTGKENSADDIKAFYDKLESLKAHGITFIILHNTGHAEETQERGRGSSVIADRFDNGYLLTNSGKRHLEEMKLEFGEKQRIEVDCPIEFSFDPNTGMFVPRGAEQQLSVLLDGFMWNHPGLVKTEFVETAVRELKKFGASRDKVREYLDQQIINQRWVGLDKGEKNAKVLYDAIYYNTMIVAQQAMKKVGL